MLLPRSNPRYILVRSLAKILQAWDTRISVRGAQCELAVCVLAGISPEHMKDTSPRGAAGDQDKDLVITHKGKRFTVDVKAVPRVGFRDDEFCQLDAEYAGATGFAGGPSRLFVPSHQSRHLADIYVHVSYGRTDGDKFAVTLLGAYPKHMLVPGRRGPCNGMEPSECASPLSIEGACEALVVNFGAHASNAALCLEHSNRNRRQFSMQRGWGNRARRGAGHTRREHPCLAFYPLTEVPARCSFMGVNPRWPSTLPTMPALLD